MRVSIAQRASLGVIVPNAGAPAPLPTSAASQAALPVAIAACPVSAPSDARRT